MNANGIISRTTLESGAIPLVRILELDLPCYIATVGAAICHLSVPDFAISRPAADARFDRFRDLFVVHR